MNNLECYIFVTTLLLLQKYTLLNLESFTEYSVWMQAFTGAGGGPFTEVVRKRTDGSKNGVFVMSKNDSLII